MDMLQQPGTIIKWVNAGVTFQNYSWQIPSSNLGKVIHTEVLCTSPQSLQENIGMVTNMFREAKMTGIDSIWNNK